MAVDQSALVGSMQGVLSLQSSYRWEEQNRTTWSPEAHGTMNIYRCKNYIGIGNIHIFPGINIDRKGTMGM